MPDPIPAPSFSNLLQRFFVEHLGRQRAVSPRTIAAYRDTFRLLLRFTETKISKAPAALALVDLDARLILSFLDHLEKERNNGARSRNARLAALRSFLRYAAHHDLAALHVIEHVLAIPMKRFDRPVLGFLSRQEMQAILEAPNPRTWAGQRDRTLFSLMYNTGARVSEIIGLRIGDVIINGSAAAHLKGKGRKDRSVPLWPSTTRLIRGWKRRLHDLSEDSLLFPNCSGGRMARSNVTQRLELAVSIAAQNHPQLTRRSISPHTIRHTTAMHLLQSGVDIAVIALWLGHESPATTHMYLEADLSMKERALNRLQPTGASPGRYRPPDQLMKFLQGL
jgi:site-specific recombinase XerD